MSFGGPIDSMQNSHKANLRLLRNKSWQNIFQRGFQKKTVTNSNGEEKNAAQKDVWEKNTSFSYQRWIKTIAFVLVLLILVMIMVNLDLETIINTIR